MTPWRRLVSLLESFTKTPEPLLGRWCHKGSHSRCDPFRKVDLANSDSCMTTIHPSAVTTPIARDNEVPKGRDSITCFVDGFGT
jgi:hypothetical protein